jgi:RHS Repeat
MKKILFLFLLAAASGCRKDTDNPILLRQIKLDNNVSQSFEYANGLLLKERWFGFCTNNNPLDEFTYFYRNGRLDKLETNARSVYSSMIAACDPASGIKSEEKFEYDNQGRLLKVTRTSSYVLFEYNLDNLVQKQVLYQTSGVAINFSTFIYDSRGNLVEVTDDRGNVSRYDYDDKKNPFYLMKQKPGWISPFNISPNNVIKATGFTSFERKITAYHNNLPVRVVENGVNYSYIYQ